MRLFNITGTCIREKHYMVDTSQKIKQIMKMIERGNYFVINRPRQYGKTTTLSLLEKELLKDKEYLPIRLSFEGIGNAPFRSDEDFGPKFLSYIGDDRNVQKYGFSNLFYDKIEVVTNFDKLSRALADIISKIDKKLVLMIDEVDKSSNNDIFIYFLGMLRNKFLNALEDKDYTFHSVILAGVHDIKNLKLKIRPESEKKFNSPWNIAMDFKVDMSFNQNEIKTMLLDYTQETGNPMDIEAISERLHFWTSGYPFLVSKLCKMLDEDFLPLRDNKEWSVTDIDKAVYILTGEKNTLFDDMGKNLENNKGLYDFMESVILGYNQYPFERLNSNVDIAYLYGLIVSTEDKKISIHNKIFEEKLTSYFLSKNEMSNPNGKHLYHINVPYLKKNGRLDMDIVLLKFQETIKEKYSNDDLLKSDEFLEKDLRLLFLMFLKPIINGIGFSFKEVQTGAEKRLDVIVVFKDEKFVVELKLWRGEIAHQNGIKQLKSYMKAESVKKGYMLIMSKNRDKEFFVEKTNGILCVYI